MFVPSATYVPFKGGYRDKGILALGVLFTIATIGALGYGTRRYFQTKSVLNELRNRFEKTTLELHQSKNTIAELHQKIRQDDNDRRDRARERARAFRENDIKRPEVQLRVLDQANLQPKQILNLQETQVFYAARRVEKKVPCFVFAQVSMGEIIRTKDDESGSAAFAAVNSKRIDILICNKKGFPILAIEHQGNGHYIGNAEERDAVKRLALERAGIALLETTPGMSSQELEDKILAAIPPHQTGDLVPA
jgi:Protein of unknown function (DUF2726)